MIYGLSTILSTKLNTAKYINLCTDAAGTIASGTAYAAIDTGATPWTVVTNSNTYTGTNTNKLTSATPGSEWGTITHILGSENSDGTSPCFLFELEESIATVVDKPFVFEIGVISLEFADNS